MKKWLPIIAAVLTSRLVLGDFQPVDINSASPKQLSVLPGVGMKVAQRIVDRRDKIGPFDSTAQLISVRGMKPSLVRKLRGKIVASRANSRKSAKRKQSSSPQLSADKLRAMIRNFDGEPIIAEVQRKAVEYAHVNPEVVTSWKSRVRKAAWLPRLQTKVSHDLDQNRSIRERAGESNTFYTRDSADWTVGADLQWRLDELLFDRDELYIARESARATAVRERILVAVTNAYFERRRLQIEEKISVKKDSEESLLRRHLTIAKHTANIDALTGGWFSNQLQKG